MWMLWVLAMLLGTAEVVFDNASQAILPEVVPPELLDRANGRKYSIDTTTNLFLGTPLGGVLFALAIWVPFGVDAVSFAVAALLVLGLRGRFVPDDVPARRPTTLRTEMGEGLRWLWRHRLLRALAVAVALVNIGFQMGQGIFVLYARQELGVDEHWFGVLLAVMGTGAIAGGLLAERIVARIGQVFALYSAIVIWALAILSYAVAPYVVVVTVMAGLLGFATTVWNVVSVGLRQSIVPHRLFGRVNSVFRWFALGAMPLGALLGGVLADVLGLRQAYAVGAFVVALAIVAMAGQVRRDPIERAMAAATAARALERDPTPQHGLADPLLD
jgi:predicted MFS family arabinose efflux permease